LAKPRLTDEKILDMLTDGRVQVFVDDLTGDVQVAKQHNGWGRMKLLEPNCGDPGRVRYNFRVNGYAQRLIYRNKLAWMSTHKTIVPDGFVVDHVDGNSLNDHPSNLQLHTKLESLRQGNDAQSKPVFDFFDYILFTGEDPPDAFD